MKQIVKNSFVATLALLALAGPIQAQVEVLSAEQVASFEKQLPEVQKSAVPKDLKTYLQTLKPGPENSLSIANAVRVANDVIASPNSTDAFFANYSVPAMSPAMRLHDTYPWDGKLGGELEIVLAQDQYESGSFVIYSFKDIEKVELKITDLKSAEGSVLAAADLDLKVVKVWYQNGNAWLSYFADPGLKLVPELLLHDENLIRVDEKEQANYARVKTKKGTKEIWISAPLKLDVGFDPYQEGFVDADTLQPVEFVAGKFKQLVLIVHTTSKTKPGTYRGAIEVKAAGQPSAKIAVAVKVLPFVLPLPKANYDLEKDFVVHLMGAWPRGLNPDQKAFLPTLKNLRQHNILQLGPGVGIDTPPDEAKKLVQGMKDAGFLTRPIYGEIVPGGGVNNRPPLSVQEQVTTKRLTQWYRDFYLKNLGNSEAFIKMGDEQAAVWMISVRPNWRIMHQQGLKTYIAGHIDTYFPTSGYVLDGRPTAGWPDEADKANLWKTIGNGHTGFYAGQHNGSENPAFVRRQHGLLGYLSNYDMVDNYQFAYGSWNDRATDLYKPMVLAYPISNGLVDTLAWEGFREGIDDIRYATKLRQLADEAIASGDLDRVYAGRKVRQWFAQMNGSTVDLNAVRLEMIEKIEQLMRSKN